MKHKISEAFKKIVQGINGFFKKNKNILYLSIPFWVMELIIQLIGHKIASMKWYSFLPLVFTLLWVGLIVGIVGNLKKRIAQIVYWICFTIAFVLFLTNAIYYPLTGFYFDANLLRVANEGSSYVMETILGTNKIIYISAIVVLILAFVVARRIPNNEKTKYKNLLKVLGIVIVVHIAISIILSSGTSALKWNNFENPKVIYKEFTDKNRSMKLCGLYEYSIRNVYISYFRPKDKINNEDEEYLSKIYNSENERTDNDYTGVFKGKNIIVLQLEGIDTWLLNEKDMPNTYGLMKESINFKNHYSLYTGGGSTFNSEFAVNTGFITPLSFNKNVYSFSDNTFDYTLAKMFKKEEYSVNAFHMNSSDFYSRGINYKNWGYDKYYGLRDIEDYKNNECELDRELINNKTFYKKMFQSKGKFLNYVITYSLHTPFSPKEGVCPMLLKEKYPDGDIPELTEEECARIQVQETDKMVGMMIQALKDNNLYDNTVIVGFADHYLYTLKDKKILDKYKTTDNNLINHTPFFIWSSDTKKVEVKDVTSQINVLPTLFNLFGIDYNTNYFIGKDALSADYDGYTFFPDYSWYDGNVYVEDGKVTNDAHIDKKKLEEKAKKVSDAIRQNDLTLKYDYLKK